MTKEELKQEAKEWIAKNSKEFITNPKYSPFDYAEAIYLAGAEPREKRIAELEAQIEKMQDDIDCLTFACENYREEMEKNLADATELEKENAELKAENDARKFAMAMSEKVEKQLREENSKLKKEWQEQVQKATDEGYARTLQTIQLTNAKELLKNILAISVHDKRQCTYDAYILTVKEAEQFLKDSEVEK